MTATSCRLPIDHLGLLSRTLDPLVDCYRRLGFSVTQPAELEAVASDGSPKQLGQRSAHIMFADDYLELTAVVEPEPGHHLASLLSSPPGLRLLLLRSEHIAEQWQQCRALGLHPAAPSDASRQINYPPGGLARFRWFGLAAEQFPGVLVGFVEHQTRELVFSDSTEPHANGAERITRVILLGDALPDGYRSLATDDAAGGLQAWPRERFSRIFPAARSTSEPLAAFAIGVKDLAATEQFLIDAGINCQPGSPGIAVQPSDAGGCGLIFETHPD